MNDEKWIDERGEVMERRRGRDGGVLLRERIGMTSKIYGRRKNGNAAGNCGGIRGYLIPY